LCFFRKPSLRLTLRLLPRKTIVGMGSVAENAAISAAAAMASPAVAVMASRVAVNAVLAARAAMRMLAHARQWLQAVRSPLPW
jgi:hypothetical protein